MALVHWASTHYIYDRKLALPTTNPWKTMYFVFMTLLFLLVCIARPLTVFLHELGHAIPSILLTGRKATIYVGSYGNPQGSMKLRIGLIDIYVRYNPLTWNVGLCVPSSAVSLNRQMLCIAAGPTMSFIIAATCCYFTFTYDLHGLLKLFLVVFLGSATLDLIVNLLPLKIPVRLHDGNITYNDGYQLAYIIRYKFMPKRYRQAMELRHEEQFAAALVKLEELIDAGKKDPQIYRLAAECCLQQNLFERAIKILENFASSGEMNADDWALLASCYSHIGKYNKALEGYFRSLEENAANLTALNNAGYLLTELNRFEDAIPLLDKAISIDNRLAYAHNNRGIAKIKSGREEDGLKDIHHSIELDSDNAYAYRNLGIYHFDKGNMEEALRFFLKAKSMNNTTARIDELINTVTAAYQPQSSVTHS